jgi:hypothetical protein
MRYHCGIFMGYNSPAVYSWKYISRINPIHPIVVILAIMKTMG